MYVYSSLLAAHLPRNISVLMSVVCIVMA